MRSAKCGAVFETRPSRGSAPRIYKQPALNEALGTPGTYALHAALSTPNGLRTQALSTPQCGESASYFTADVTPIGQLTPVPPCPQYPCGFFDRYC